MGLTTCPDCNKPMSDAAPACPHCGRPNASSTAVAGSEVHGSGEGLFLKGLNCGCLALLTIVGALLLAYIVL